MIAIAVLPLESLLIRLLVRLIVTLIGLLALGRIGLLIVSVWLAGIAVGVLALGLRIALLIPGLGLRIALLGLRIPLLGLLGLIPRLIPCSGRIVLIWRL